jgi:hypothetical protein
LPQAIFLYPRFCVNIKLKNSMEQIQLLLILSTDLTCLLETYND